jgi:hypothetical protein
MLPRAAGHALRGERRRVGARRGRMAWRDGFTACERGQLYEYAIRRAEAAATKPPKQDLRETWSRYRNGGGGRTERARASLNASRALHSRRRSLQRGMLNSCQPLGFTQPPPSALTRRIGRTMPGNAGVIVRPLLARLPAREGMMQQVADAYCNAGQQRVRVRHLLRLSPMGAIRPRCTLDRSAPFKCRVSERFYDYRV